MSALTPIADIRGCSRNVRLAPITDISAISILNVSTIASTVDDMLGGRPNRRIRYLLGRRDHENIGSTAQPAYGFAGNLRSAIVSAIPEFIWEMSAKMHYEFPTRSSTMRYQLVFFSISLALLLLAGNAVMAQTATPASTASTALSKRALRHQDSEVCTKQAAQQNIARRNQADFVRKCMAERQASRKTTAKPK
jgi:hypothetical protein